MPSKSVVFESADGASVSLPDRTVFLRPGETHKATDPGEIAKWRSTKGVREVKRPSAKQKSSTPKGSRAKASISTGPATEPSTTGSEGSQGGSK